MVIQSLNHLWPALNHAASTDDKSPLHSSYERGCQEKILSPALAGNQDVVIYIQPCLLIRGAFDVAALDRRVVQRRCRPQCVIPT